MFCPGSLVDSRCLASWVGRGEIGSAQQPPKQTTVKATTLRTVCHSSTVVISDLLSYDPISLSKCAASTRRLRGHCPTSARLARQHRTASRGRLPKHPFPAPVPPGTGKSPPFSRVDGAWGATCRLRIGLRRLMLNIPRSAFLGLPKRSSSGRRGG